MELMDAERDLPMSHYSCLLLQIKCCVLRHLVCNRQVSMTSRALTLWVACVLAAIIIYVRRCVAICEGMCSRPWCPLIIACHSGCMHSLYILAPWFLLILHIDGIMEWMAQSGGTTSGGLKTSSYYTSKIYQKNTFQKSRQIASEWV